ncbi:MAG: DUF3450 family protein, partial [bacterium]
MLIYDQVHSVFSPVYDRAFFSSYCHKSRLKFFSFIYESTIVFKKTIFIYLIMAGPAMSSESSLQLSEQLIALRAEVDQLQTQLDTDRQEHKATMASLATQAGDLENQANRQKVLLSQLKDKLKKTQTLSAQTITDSETLEPLLQDVISQIVQSIKSGLPFKKEQRIAAIKEISQQIAEKKLDTYRATSRISSIIEDELRLTHDNGIYSQTIPLNGDNLLVDVAKIGMYTLYFRTKDQQ